MTERVIRVVLDPSGVQRGSDQVQRALGRVDGRTERTRRSFGLLTRAAAGLGAALSVRQVIRYADSWNQVQNRLRLVTTGHENLAAVTNAVFEVAQRTRTEYASTAELYARVARSAGRLGATQAELLEFTEGVSQAIQVSGASAAEASAGIIQFSQGLASGALRGDELRSVLEQLPRLAQAIADGMNVDIGRLRELGEAGELTARQIYDAIRSQLPQLREEFEKLEPTVAQSFTVLQNSAMRAISVLDSGVGITDNLADAILGLSRWIEGPMIDALVGLDEQFEIIGEQFDEFAEFVNTTWPGLVEDFIREGGDLSEFLGDAFAQLPLNVKAAVELATVEIASFLDRTGLGVEAFFLDVAGTAATIVGADGRVDTIIRRRLEISQRLGNVAEARMSSIDAILTERSAALDRIDERIAAARAERDAQATAGALAGVLGDIADGEAGASTEAEKLRKEMEQLAERVFLDTRTSAEALNMELVELDRLFAGGFFDDYGGADTYARAVAAVYAEFAKLDELTETFGLSPEVFEEVGRIWEETRTPLEQYNDQVERLKELRDQGAFDEFGGDETFQRAMESAADELERAEKAARRAAGEFDVLEQFGVQAARNIQSSLASALSTGIEDVDEFAAALIGSFRDIASEILANQILRSLFSRGAGLGGGLGDFFGSALQGISGREKGGTVSAGQSVIVGERRPEIFTAPTSGRILPDASKFLAPREAAAAPTVNVEPPKVEVPLNVTVVDDASRAPVAINERQFFVFLSQHKRAVREALSGA